MIGKIVLGVWAIGVVGCVIAALVGAVADPYAWWPVQMLVAGAVSFGVGAVLCIIGFLIVPSSEKEEQE